MIRPGVAEEAWEVVRFGGPCTYSTVSLGGFVRVADGSGMGERGEGGARVLV